MAPVRGEEARQVVESARAVAAGAAAVLRAQWAEEAERNLYDLRRDLRSHTQVKFCLEWANETLRTVKLLRKRQLTEATRKARAGGASEVSFGIARSGARPRATAGRSARRLTRRWTNSCRCTTRR